MHCITVHMKRQGLGLWNTLLQKGVVVRARVGISVSAFLEQQLGIDAAYVENVVRTIFVNGSPVDDVNTAPVNDGDVLALAGAMPGLVGIAMGRDTLVSSFRSDISCRGGEVSEDGTMGLVTVKAFNVVAQTAGEKILNHGIVLSAEAFQLYLTERMKPLAATILSIRVGTNELAFEELFIHLEEGSSVLLQVLAE